MAEIRLHVGALAEEIARDEAYNSVSEGYIEEGDVEGIVAYSLSNPDSWANKRAERYVNVLLGRTAKE